MSKTADIFPRCKDCLEQTDAGPCPHCGAVICLLCAEREGAFCCVGELADDPLEP